MADLIIIGLNESWPWLGLVLLGCEAVILVKMIAKIFTESLEEMDT